MRQDEIELIERVRKRSLFHERIASPRCRCTLVPMEIINEPIHRGPSQRVPVPVDELPQEDTIAQIERMIDALPTTNECPEDASGCLLLRDLMISAWAREFLKQLIRK